MAITSRQIISSLQLLPHPEGGYYKETYRCTDHVTNADGNKRNVSTAIYYMLEGNDRSNFHRIKSDELWFFHQGQPLEIFYILNGELKTILLGNDILNNESPQCVIPANTWFASKIKSAREYSLVSCTVAPGFDFADFEMAERKYLTYHFPALKTIIDEFTK